MKHEEIYQRLMDAGYKLTLPRKLITEWITCHKGTFSVSEILQHLTDLDKVTAYRTLDLFCSLDIIHSVLSLHGEQHYEIHQKQNHHHHIVCERCEKNECIPCEVPKKEFTSFQKIHHSLVFTGLCIACHH